MSLPAADHRAARFPLALIALLAISTLVRLITAWQLGLGQDEVYALAVSHPFQLSFFDHPPLSFWIAEAMQALFGAHISPFLLRLPFVLMFTGTIWAMYALTARFYGRSAGLWAATLLSLAPFFATSAGGWVMPDGPLMLFLTLAAIFYARTLFGAGAQDEVTSRWGNWLLTGLCLGLALLSKYQSFLILFGAFVLLWTPRHRHWLARPQPYVAIALAAVIFSPVLWWNAHHDWISFAFQLGRGGGAPALDPARWVKLLLGESLYLFPWTAAGLVVAAILGAAGRWPYAGFCLALALPAVLLFNLQPFFGPAGQPHWSMAGWLFLFPLLGRALADQRSKGRRWPFAMTGVSGVVFAALAGTVLVYANDYSLFAHFKGIDAFARESNSWTGVRKALTDKGLLTRPHTFLAATGWRHAASFAEAVRPQAPIVLFSNDPRGFAFRDQSGNHIGEDGVFAVLPTEAAQTIHMAKKYFASVETLGTYPTYLDGVAAFSITIVLAHNLQRPFPLPYPKTTSLSARGGSGKLNVGS